MRPHIPYAKQEITEEDILAVTKVLRSDNLTQGPMIRRFEEQFSTVVESPWALACANGTAALHLALQALHRPGAGKVITTPMTFAATANCTLYVGGEFQLLDTDPAGQHLDLQQLQTTLEQAPQGSFQGLVVMDYGGHPCDMERVAALAKKYGLWVVEDACHALGAKYPCQKTNQSYATGSCRHSDLAVFSFHPAKHITSGEGGMVTGSDPQLREKISLLRQHGLVKAPEKLINAPHGPWYQELQQLGQNYRLTDIHASLGLSQLQRLSSIVDRRQKLAQRYRQKLQHLPLEMPLARPGYTHSYHLFAIQTPLRDSLIKHLHQHNIGAQVHYVPLYYHPYYQNLGQEVDPAKFPNCENFYRQCLSLPLFPSLSYEQQDIVIQVIEEFFQ